jgi:succinate dehydrogenase/fumarate reductase flavoprotein subunit
MPDSTASGHSDAPTDRPRGHVCDFLVIGSGGGGMLAAVRAHDLGLRTLVVESSDKFGGFR